MKFLYILLCVALTACTVGIRPPHYQKAEEMCKTNDGVKMIWVDSNTITLVCNNGLEKTVSKAGL